MRISDWSSDVCSSDLAGADTRADRFVDLPVDAWSGMVRRNVLTMMESCHFFAGAMARRGHGGVLIIGSEAAYCAAARAGIYSVTQDYGLPLVDAFWAIMDHQVLKVLNVLIRTHATPMLPGRIH